MVGCVILRPVGAQRVQTFYRKIGQGWAQWAGLFGLHSANISYIGVGHASPNSLPHGNVPMFGVLSIDRCALHTVQFYIPPVQHWNFGY